MARFWKADEQVLQDFLKADIEIYLEIRYLETLNGKVFDKKDFKSFYKIFFYISVNLPMIFRNN